MVAPGDQRGTGRRADRRRVKARVFQSIFGEALERRGIAWPAERARRTEADVVD
jgi:hypothetical protein